MAHYYPEGATATGESAPDGAGQLALEFELKLFGQPVRNLITCLQGDVRLERAMALVEGDYSDPTLTLGRAARTGGASKNHLNVLLRRRIGFTFHQLLVRYRLLRALPAIAAGGNKLNVALDVGFGTVRSFQRSFASVFPTTSNRLKFFMPATQVRDFCRDFSDDL
jgi:AraC-like DNA-binding protein